MMEWVKFFVGTPKRFAWTVAGFMIILAMIAPNLAAHALNNVLAAGVNAFGPLVGPLLAIAIAIAGIRLMFRPWRSKQKRKDH